MFSNTNKLLKPIALLTALAVPAMQLMAQATAPAAAPVTDGYTILRYLLTAVAVLFLLIIAVLAYGIKTASDIYVDKIKTRKAAAKAAASVVALLLISSVSLAQTAAPAAAAAVAEVPKFSMPFDIWIFIAVILIEFIAILAMVWLLYGMLEVKSKKDEALARSGKPRISLFDKLNNAVPVDQEETLDLDHSYDGIRELDNKIPAWWSWTFYATIVFAVIYLYRMFISGSLLKQADELARDKEIAAVEQAAYLKNSSNNVDENTVTMLDAAGIAAGKATYEKNCTPCHGAHGEGNAVGPNLTDDYWIHKGSLKDIFYSIKYGWAEKGMRSWKEDFSPSQIAELASYVKSIHGTKPAGAKDPQGDLYTDDGAAAPAAGSAPAAAADSTKK